MVTGAVLDKPVVSGLERNASSSHHQDALPKAFLEENHSSATSVHLKGHSLLSVLIDTVMRTVCYYGNQPVYRGGIRPSSLANIVPPTTTTKRRNAFEQSKKSAAVMWCDANHPVTGRVLSGI